MYFISEVVSAIDSSKKLIEGLEGFGQCGRYYIALLNWNLPFVFFWPLSVLSHVRLSRYLVYPTLAIGSPPIWLVG